MGEFITVSLHCKSRSVFQGKISWSDFPRSEKYRLPWESRFGGSLGRDFGKLGSWGDCKVTVGIDWEGFCLFFNYSRQGGRGYGIGIAGNVAARGPRSSSPSLPPLPPAVSCPRKKAYPLQPTAQGEEGCFCSRC